MGIAFEEVIKDTSVSKMIDRGAEYVRRESLGFSPTGCQTQSIYIISIINHCIDNNAIFTDSQFNNIVNILNSV